MKKWIIIVFSILLPLSVSWAFSDLKSVPDYADSINHLKGQGILADKEQFFPKRLLQRVEFVQMLYLANLFPSSCNHEPIRFSDTQLNQWYTPALRVGVLCGGIKGDHKGRFRPADPINYAEAATLMYRLSGVNISSSGAWYEAGISFLKEKGVSLNKKPNEFVNRAEGAFLIDQLLKQGQSFSGQKLVSSARLQKGVVTSYDTGYYSGGFPPENTGACTDVVERAMRELGYDWKSKIDQHMLKKPNLYTSKYDANINYRRVRNVKIFLDHTATSLPLDDDYLPGDIVTYDQIPGSLWHIAIVSDKKTWNGTPLLIHNYGKGVVEDNLLHKWPAPKTGHYRLKF